MGLASLPGALRRSLDPGWPLESTDHHKGRPRAVPRHVDLAQPVGIQSCPQPSARPVPGLGPSSPSTASTPGSFQGVGCARGAFCVCVAVPVCCPHVHPHTCLCDCVHVCVHSGVCPCVSVCVSVCVPMCLCIQLVIYGVQLTEKGWPGRLGPQQETTWGKGGSRVQGDRVWPG